MTQENNAQPPVALTVPHTVQAHGEQWRDDYFWLRERDNPATIAYLEAENEYTAALMTHAETLREELYQEMVGRIQETDVTAPVRHGHYLYYIRTETGQQYKIHCRRALEPDSPEEILLDENELAAPHDYFRLAVTRVSPDHRRLAYTFNTTGSDQYTIRVKDLASGELLPDAIDNCGYAPAWASDSLTLFYTVLNEAQRPYQLRRYTLGAGPQDDVLVYEEPDDRFYLGVERSASGRYLLLSLTSKVTTEVHFVSADEPTDPFRIIAPRRYGIEYSVTHHGDHFYILTNAGGAVNFKLVRAPVANPGPENWAAVLPYDPAVKLDLLLAFRDHLALFERREGLSQILVMAAPGETPEPPASHRIHFPEPVYTVRPGENPEFNTTQLRFNYSSLVTPNSVYDYDMATRTRALQKQTPVLGGYDPADYESARIWATAPDGTAVPISLVYRRDRRQDGPQRCLLYGYGSYGYSLDPVFNSNRVSLLDRGFIYAIAHVRGGGEMGRPWYEAGKFQHKKNTFTDFIACAEHLIAAGYTRPELLAAMGRSAGGLLMGVIVNERPDLFKAVVAGVPFVDVINTMLDPTIPLTVIEYDEWGNPNERDFYDYMKSYSPYDNVTAQAYPDLLITAGLNDPRVQYWEPAKWMARLRACQAGDGLLLLKTNMGAGHSGASGRYDYLKELAFEYAFLLDKVGNG